jgi:hypothetical protein
LRRVKEDGTTTRGQEGTSSEPPYGASDGLKLTMCCPTVGELRAVTGAASVSVRINTASRPMVSAFARALPATLLFRISDIVEPKNGVTLRVDYGVGKDEGALYVSVGEAF